MTEAEAIDKLLESHNSYTADVCFGDEARRREKELAEICRVLKISKRRQLGLGIVIDK